MHDLGIHIENFNPRLIYMFKRKFSGEKEPPCHVHDFSSFVYMMSGSCTYKIDGEIYPVKKGDLIVLNPGCRHGRKLEKSEDTLEFHIGFNNICLQGLPKDFIISGDNSPVVSLVKYGQEFFKCSNDILAEHEKNECGSNLMLKTMVMQLIVLFLKELHVSEVNNSETLIKFESYDRIQVVNAIVSYINDNYMKDMSLEKISKNMYLSSVYISKIFKEETGDSPINYLIKTRLSHAVDLLKQEHTSIKSVAKDVGYNDAYYFSRLFKKYYGMPPSKYKMSHGA